MNRRTFVIGLAALALPLTGCSNGGSLAQDGIDAGDYGRAATDAEQPKLVTENDKRLLVFPERFNLQVELYDNGRAGLTLDSARDKVHVATDDHTVATTGGGGVFEFPVGETILMIAYENPNKPGSGVYWENIPTS